MTKFIITVMASGFSVTTEGSAPFSPSMRDMARKQAAQSTPFEPEKFNHASSDQSLQYAPSLPRALPYAFSTFAEVVLHIHEQLGFDQQVEAESQCEAAKTLVEPTPKPDFDWLASDRRQSALNHAAALAYNINGSPDDVLRAASKYEQYLKGEPSPVDTFETKPKLDRMKMYVGTKALYARSMTRGDYNAYRGSALPEGENADDAGQIVQYSDGYISWTPQAQFDAAYKAI